VGTVEIAVALFNKLFNALGVYDRFVGFGIRVNCRVFRVREGNVEFLADFMNPGSERITLTSVAVDKPRGALLARAMAMVDSKVVRISTPNIIMDLDLVIETDGKWHSAPRIHLLPPRDWRPLVGRSWLKP
jgi:hypothetical protein